VAPYFTWQAYSEWGDASFYDQPKAKPEPYTIGLARPLFASFNDVLSNSIYTDENRRYVGPFAHLCAFLEREGSDFDCVTDVELHQEAYLLDGVKRLIVAGRSEYWTAEMASQVERFVKRNGNRFLNLSGNTYESTVVYEEQYLDPAGHYKGDKWPRLKLTGAHKSIRDKLLGLNYDGIASSLSSKDFGSSEFFRDSSPAAASHPFIANFPNRFAGVTLTHQGVGWTGGVGGEFDDCSRSKDIVVLASGHFSNGSHGHLCVFNGHGANAVLNVPSINFAGTLPLDLYSRELVRRAIA